MWSSQGTGGSRGITCLEVAELRTKSGLQLELQLFSQVIPEHPIWRWFWQELVASFPFVRYDGAWRYTAHEVLLPSRPSSPFPSATFQHLAGSHPLHCTASLPFLVPPTRGSLRVSLHWLICSFRTVLPLSRCKMGLLTPLPRCHTSSCQHSIPGRQPVWWKLVVQEWILGKKTLSIYFDFFQSRLGKIKDSPISRDIKHQHQLV